MDGIPLGFSRRSSHACRRNSCRWPALARRPACADEAAPARQTPDHGGSLRVLDQRSGDCALGSTRAPRVPARALAGRREAREKVRRTNPLARLCVPRGAEHRTRGACAPQPRRTTHRAAQHAGAPTVGRLRPLSEVEPEATPTLTSLSRNVQVSERSGRCSGEGAGRGLLPEQPWIEGRENAKLLVAPRKALAFINAH